MSKGPVAGKYLPRLEGGVKMADYPGHGGRARGQMHLRATVRGTKNLSTHDKLHFNAILNKIFKKLKFV